MKTLINELKKLLRFLILLLLTKAWRSFIYLRNYKIDDPNYTRVENFVHYKFLPGLGFYGLV